jgi:hypothetical protein
VDLLKDELEFDDMVHLINVLEVVLLLNDDDDDDDDAESVD